MCTPPLDLRVITEFGLKYFMPFLAISHEIYNVCTNIVRASTAVKRVTQPMTDRVLP
jgi:hypothetical protein